MAKGVRGKAMQKARENYSKMTEKQKSGMGWGTKRHADTRTSTFTDRKEQSKKLKGE